MLGCDPNPAFGDDIVTIDFTQGSSDSFALAEYTEITYDDNNGAVFTIKDDNDAPTMVSKKYLFFGRVDAVVQAAPGIGIITSFTLQSDDLDEIDWEWLGGDTEKCQSNYFGKGNTTTYDRGAYHAVSNTTGSFHTYSIEWTADKIDWIIDGAVVRTLNYADAQNGDQYPQTPMQVRLGTWVAGAEGNSEGTIEWAGGLADFNDAPFVAFYKSITIADYANGVDRAKEYVWTDDSGSYTSIQVIVSDEEDDNGDESSNTTTNTPKMTSLSNQAPSSDTNTRISNTNMATTATSTASNMASSPTDINLGLSDQETTSSEVNTTAEPESSTSSLSVGISDFAICVFILGIMVL